jgi:hypothetical protein
MCKLVRAEIQKGHNPGVLKDLLRIAGEDDESMASSNPTGSCWKTLRFGLHGHGEEQFRKHSKQSTRSRWKY